MPANPKHLTKSPWQQFSKTTTGIIGGYSISALLHMCLPLYLPNPKEVLVTGVFTVFMVWCILLLLPFLFKNGWKAMGVYLGIIVVLYGIFYIGNQNNPFI